MVGIGRGGHGPPIIARPIADCEPHVPPHDGPLEAISHADLASIKTMLTLSIPEGVDLDTSLDTDGNTALMLAAQTGREDLVRFLLSDEIAALLPEPIDHPRPLGRGS